MFQMFVRVITKLCFLALLVVSARFFIVGNPLVGCLLLLVTGMFLQILGGMRINEKLEAEKVDLNRECADLRLELFLYRSSGVKVPDELRQRFTEVPSDTTTFDPTDLNA